MLYYDLKLSLSEQLDCSCKLIPLILGKKIHITTLISSPSPQNDPNLQNRPPRNPQLAKPRSEPPRVACGCPHPGFRPLTSTAA